jgi:hypothetical protein
MINFVPRRPYSRGKGDNRYFACDLDMSELSVRWKEKFIWIEWLSFFVYAMYSDKVTKISSCDTLTTVSRRPNDNVNIDEQIWSKLH